MQAVLRKAQGSQVFLFFFLIRWQILKWLSSVEDRVMTPEDALRPPFVSFMHCNNVRIEGVTIKNSPFWVIHPIFCQDVVVRGVTVNSHALEAHKAKESHIALRSTLGK